MIILLQTLERSYLLKLNGKIWERPQHMLMRVSIGIHGEDIELAIQTYNLMSERWFTHASPTLFNSGTNRPQLSSCFLLSMMDDSIEGIYETLTRCALISKSAGGIGLNIHCIRATGSYIAGVSMQNIGCRFGWGLGCLLTFRTYFFVHAIIQHDTKNGVRVYAVLSGYITTLKNVLCQCQYTFPESMSFWP